MVFDTIAERQGRSVPAGTGHRHPLLRRWVIALAVVYVVALALIAFWPVPVDRNIDGPLLHLINWLHQHGAPGWFRYSTVEFGANIVLFIPVGVFIVVLAGARRWWWAILVGFAASCTIELCQLLFLSSRFATLNDVIANTSGAVVGALLGLVLLILAEIARPRTHAADV
ncbi:VanZ family protein [Cryobacterium sp. RTS3]|uniref:VanZ family protein n=1 Tax=Cryobacterium sp. RTS3 TaxID=3048643 RepID=UPI002B22B051|nr:VanZ family protein [Cryobacterium sp. RTS3]MEA9999680.1 VanZ family protein [Cryobacterium sp. RTS3]